MAPNSQKDAYAAKQSWRPTDAVLAEAKMLATEWWNGARWESLTDSQRSDALINAKDRVKRLEAFERKQHGNHTI